MGYPKPLLRIGDETFLAHASAAMLAGVSRLVIVLGAHADRIRAEVPTDTRIRIVENPRYARGQLSSLKIGLAALSADASAAIVHLTDHPTVRPSTFRGIISEYERTGKPIVIARYNGRRGHPVLFEGSLFGELLAAPEDQGARVVVNDDPARVAYLEVDDPGVVLDLDTPADLADAGFPPPPATAMRTP